MFLSNLQGRGGNVDVGGGKQRGHDACGGRVIVGGEKEGFMSTFRETPSQCHTPSL